MHVTPNDIAFIAAATILALWKYTPVLDRLKKKSSADAAGELDIADRTIERLRHERDQAVDARNRLEQTRSLEPILKQIAANAELQAQVLDRLVHHNGSFKHMEKSLREIGEGLKLITGFIAGVLEIPVKEKTP